MILRTSMVRVLMNQQLQRLKKNPAAIVLLVLIISIAILVGSGGMLQRLQQPQAAASRFWILYDEESAWVDHLRKHEPNEVPVRFLSRDEVAWPLPAGVHALEVQQSLPASNNAGRTMVRGADASSDNGPAFPHQANAGSLPGMPDEKAIVRVIVHPSSGDEAELRKLSEWLWRESTAHFGQVSVRQEMTDLRPQRRTRTTLEQTSLSDLMTPATVGVVLIFAIQFFTCTHLLVSIAGQDRERGTTLALALTPASLEEILVARSLFHLIVTLLVSGVVVAILVPAQLSNGLLWSVLIVGSLGFVCVGTLISSLTRSQGTAGLSTVCYMLLGALIFYLAARFPAVAVVRLAAFEHYGFPLLLHAFRGGGWSPVAANLLLKMSFLVVLWLGVSGRCYRRMGWQ